jgi:hypothetical protein
VASLLLDYQSLPYFETTLNVALCISMAAVLPVPTRESFVENNKPAALADRRKACPYIGVRCKENKKKETKSPFCIFRHKQSNHYFNNAAQPHSDRQ